MNFFVIITINNEVYMRTNINVFVSVRVSVWCLVQLLRVTLPTLLGVTYSQTILPLCSTSSLCPDQLSSFSTCSPIGRAPLPLQQLSSSVRSAHAPSATNSRGARFLPTCMRPVFVTTSQGSNITSWRLTYPAEARRS